jgi:hypothetical protein
MSKCSICGEREAVMCHVCHGKESKERRQSFKKMIFKTRENKCEECGNRDREVLSIHHDRINDNNHYDTNTVRILCMNCHTKIHGMGARDD